LKVCLISNSGWNLFNFRGELIEFLLSKKLKVESISSKDKYIEKLKCKNHPILAKPKSLNLIDEFKALAKLAHFLLHNDFDLLMVFTVRTCLEVLLINKFIKKPLILNITGLGILNRDDSSFLKTLLLITARFLFKSKYIKKIVFQSTHDRDFFLHKKMCTQELVEMVPGSGVNLQKFQSVTNTKIEKIRFLHMSRLLVSKGVVHFCEAARQFEKEDSVDFLLAGEFDENDKDCVDQAYVQNYHKKGIIHFLGFQENIAKLLDSIDCVVLLTSYPEGIPKSLIEAAASGKIIISSAHPGCKEVVKNKYNGFVLENADHVTLIEAVKKILSLEKEDIDKMKRNSLNIAYNKFDIRMVNQKYHEMVIEAGHGS